MSLAHDLQEYVTRAAQALDGAAEVSITLSEHGVVAPLCGSGAAAARCDRASQLAAEGPGVAAVAQRATQLVPRAADEPRWDAWRRAVAREGFRRAVVTPAEVRPGVVVTLTLYSRAVGPWPDRSVRVAEALVHLLAREMRLRSRPRTLEALALRRRDDATVERAVGVLRVLDGGTADDARRTLHATASRHAAGVPATAEAVIRSVAPRGGDGEIVDRHRGTDGPGGPAG